MLERAARNLPRVKVLRAEGANVDDILRYEHLVMTRAAVDALQREGERHEGPSHDIVTAPLITEKGTLVNEPGNQVRVPRATATPTRYEIRQRHRDACSR